MKTTNLVAKMLSEVPRTRDSDRLLIGLILQELGANLSQGQLDIIIDVNFESIRRTRQKLQEQGKYPASPEVAKQRKLKSMVIEQNAPTAKPEYLGKLIDGGIEVTHYDEIGTVPKAVDWMKDE